MDILQYLGSLAVLSVIIPLVKGKVTCVCTTFECQLDGQTTCEAEYLCYVEDKNSVVTRGCIDSSGAPLTCENWKSSKLRPGVFDKLPVTYCCKNEDFCNKDILPAKPTERIPEPDDYAPDDNNPYVRHEDEDDDKSPCPNSNSSDSSKLNPIYIAVPVAGVCVLLALIIFAMYLLRRRNDFYAQYEAYQYHEQLARLANKQNETRVQACDSNVNRCTDSERSSQGSETKLFLNA